MKKIPRRTVTKQSTQSEPENAGFSPWKLLVVDDEPDVHQVTRLNLRDFIYAGRQMVLLEANSGSEARAIIAEHPDIAVALIDVVMESEDAGLQLVRHIREQLGNEMVRLLIRTGQPGVAPERFVIDNYDIDGYHDKTDLTAQKLYTSVRASVKSYKDLRTIDLNRTGLSHVLHATSQLYHATNESLNQFFQGILNHIIGLFQIGENSLLSTIEGMVIAFDDHQLGVRAGTGRFNPTSGDYNHIDKIINVCSQRILQEESENDLPEDSLLLPLMISHKPVGFVYLEHVAHLSPADQDLLSVMVHQCSGALANLLLHRELSESYQKIIDILALAAEYRDSVTGEHIRRIADYTTAVALALGIDPEEACRMGQAARLHDVGKVGIPDAILQKKGRLTDQEFEVIKTHSQIGSSILERDRNLDLARDIALNHHEQWDGQGYPQGLAGDEIPLAACIVSLVDVYDALTHRRTYKEAWSHEEAIEFICSQRGKKFHPEVTDAFLKIMAAHTNKK